ncbi:MAG: hypothetical protein OSJ54_12755 [Oscillospiraceae bacterium]|nr:hypothetical protein [Oscillospiraceae bacterium]
MDRSGKIEEHDDICCIECGKKICESCDYHIIKRNKKLGGGFIHIHKSCYERLLPKNKKKKEVIL